MRFCDFVASLFFTFQQISKSESDKKMMDLIRLGDDTDHGGKVISASETMRYDGRFVARKGDEVSCPKHGMELNLIIEGDESTMDEGVPIARQGYRAMCGCRLISSLV
jgi:uncharacterized Zn-binding protein involved in type VI secretion